MQKPTFASSSKAVHAALQATLLLVGVLWLQEILDQILFAERLDRLGIVPRHTRELWHAPLAPFLHGGWAHIIANTVPLAVLSFLTALRGLRRWWHVVASVAFVGGFLVWLLGRGGSVHLGASMLIFGYFGFLLAAAWYERSLGAVALAVVTAALYGGIVWGVLPSAPGISFEGHLFGMLAGVLAARNLRRSQ